MVFSGHGGKPGTYYLDLEPDNEFLTTNL